RALPCRSGAPGGGADVALPRPARERSPGALGAARRDRVAGTGRTGAPGPGGRIHRERGKFRAAIVAAPPERRNISRQRLREWLPYLDQDGAPRPRPNRAGGSLMEGCFRGPPSSTPAPPSTAPPPLPERYWGQTLLGSDSYSPAASHHAPAL